MSLDNSPAIVKHGLVFHYDMNNPKSYAGPPLTNILPNGINAGYPTYPSGWGTYNTNQYGSGAYFSIGTISSVSNNIVTCNGHSLRTYDVVTPQVSGGGVTVGTSYLVRKWDANTFSLYSYDGTQDHINIFDVEGNFNTDTRISVSSGITNMWWGPPHLPNSGIIKRIVPNGFRWQGRVHDCLRVHWHRPDGVTDGLAYGNEASIASNTTYTVSFWVRAATPNCVGKNVYCEQYINGYDTGTTFTLQKEWSNIRIQFTSTQSGALNLYWFNSNCPAQSAWDISEIMVYAGTGPSKKYISSGATRSNTQAIIDLTGNNVITANSLTYNSDGTFSFSAASSNNATVAINNLSTNAISKSWEVWVLPSTTQSWAGLFGHVISGGCTYYCNGGLCIASGNYQLNWYDNSSYNFLDSGVVATANVPVHIVGTYDASDTKCRIYVNGILKNTSAATNMNYGGNAYSIQIGYLSASGNYYTGKINTIRHYYNKALSGSEVFQNFSASRGRYGI